MYRKTVAVILTALGVALTPAASAHDKGSTQHRNSFLRSVVVDHLGARAPGRDIVNDGLTNGKKPSHAQIKQYLDTLRRMAFPPVYAAATSTVATTASIQVPSVGGGDPGLASIRACESGGNYATNTGNGFSGAYQFDNATWQAAGGSTAAAYQASPAEQDRVAANWIASGHRAAWPNC